MDIKASGMKSKAHAFNQNAHALGATRCGMDIKASGMKSIPHHFLTK